MGAALRLEEFELSDEKSLFSKQSHRTEYHFDALGRRVAKAVTNGSTSFVQSYVYLGKEDRPLQGKAGNGAVTLYLDGQLNGDHLGEVKGSSVKGYVTDHLGSVLNGDGAGSSKSYGLFGEPNGTVALASSSAAVNYGFAGYAFDPESSKYHMHARQYDPSTGRWLSQEPIGLAGDINLYRYGRNNPLNYVDRDGKNPALVAVGLGAFAGAMGNLAGTAMAGKLTYDNFVSTAVIGGIGGAAAVITSGAAASAAALGAGATLIDILAIQVGGTGLIAAAGSVLLDVGTTVIFNSEDYARTVSNASGSMRTDSNCAKLKDN